MVRPHSLIMVIGTLLLVLVGSSLVCPSSGAQTLPSHLEQETYRRLDAVVAEKQAQLEAYLERILAHAEDAGDDPLLLDYFRLKREFWHLQQQAPPTPEVQQAIEELKRSLRDHYLSHYQSFYDILFVDRSGFVLSSIRNQADYHKNLFVGDLARTTLAQRLRQQPGTAFVDYDFYWVSDEPSAFFVRPVTLAGERAGWLVLQCSLNRINDIFCGCNSLGPTGETFLVNRQHRMMTESRLRPGGENLRRILAKENIDTKFREGRGHRRVIDYRGFPALTSFAVCPVLESEWLLVAKVDEDAVLTEQYERNQDSLEEAAVAAWSRPPRTRTQNCAMPSQPVLVDMDEYRSSAEAPLLTFGVATCTAVVIRLPGGKVFMGHASQNDRIYGRSSMDVVGRMLTHIKRFEIYPYQLRELEVVLVAPHTESLVPAVDLFLEEGILLSQIRFLRDPSAEAATVLQPAGRGAPCILWTIGGDGGTYWQRATDIPTLAEMLKGLPASG